MGENTGEGKAAEAARLRAYAKEQGRLVRRLRRNETEPLFYVTEQRNGETVRVAAQPAELTLEERQRQTREAIKAAEQARRNANAEAKRLEQQ